MKTAQDPKDRFKHLIREGSELKTVDNAWIDPNGIVYKMQGFAQHNEFALDWIDYVELAHLVDGDKLARLDAQEKLLSTSRSSYHYEHLVDGLKWIRMCCWTGAMVTLHTHSGERGLTAAQKATIEEWKLWNPHLVDKLDWIN